MIESALLLTALMAGTSLLLRPETLSTGNAIVALVATLTVRAILVLLAVAVLAFHLPASATFQDITSWCLHAVLPVADTHLGLSGHSIVESVSTLPTLLVLVSVLSLTLAVVHAERKLRSALKNKTLGNGPAESTMIGGPEITIAAAGLTQPKVVISTGALISLDDEELAASIEHEKGHINRKHRFISLYAAICCAVARFLPGTTRVANQLDFFLERDADEYAIKQAHSPAALATAIRKAVSIPNAAPSALFLSGGASLEHRLRLLTDSAHAQAKKTKRGAVITTALVGMTLLVAASAAAALPDLTHVPLLAGTTNCSD